VRREDIRAYACRDWDLIDRSRVEYLASLEERERVEAGFRAADALRRQTLEQHPDWPTPEERARDLDCHLRVSELLRRASAALCR
jgi:hypothetical protein